MLRVPPRITSLPRYVEGCHSNVDLCRDGSLNVTGVSQACRRHVTPCHTVSRVSRRCHSCSRVAEMSLGVADVTLVSPGVTCVSTHVASMSQRCHGRVAPCHGMSQRVNLVFLRVYVATWRHELVALGGTQGVCVRCNRGTPSLCQKLLLH